jgi:hypothetical protein
VGGGDDDGAVNVFPISTNDRFALCVTPRLECFPTPNNTVYMQLLKVADFKPHSQYQHVVKPRYLSSL